MKVEFTPDSVLGKALKDFWRGLKDDSGGRAELRRCDNVNQVKMTGVFSRFYNKLRKTPEGSSLGDTQMAVIVGLLSHLKFDAESEVLGGKAPYEGYMVAKQLAKDVGGRPLVSELRFRRLLQNDRNDLYPAMLRIVRMTKGSINLYGLAHSIYYWGDGVKKTWAYAYFPVVPATKTA